MKIALFPQKICVYQIFLVPLHRNSKTLLPMRAENVKTLSDFFQFAQEWMCEGDTLKCLTDTDAMGKKVYVLKDRTQYTRYRFTEHDGLTQPNED